MSSKKQVMNQGKSRKAKKGDKRTPKRELQIKDKKTVKRSYESFGGILPNQDGRVQISATLSLESYRKMFFGFISYLAQKNVINVDKENQAQQWASVYDGTTYLLQNGGTLMAGATQEINSLPRVFDNFFQCMLPKQLTFDCGLIAYGWKSFDTTPLILAPTPIYGHSWAPTYVNSDGGAPAEPAQVWGTPIDPKGQYPTLQAIVNNLDIKGNLQTVAWMESKTISKEVSSFSRVYSYVGNESTPQLGGAWIDVENEVRITAPMLAKFVPYQDSVSATDPRLPTDLKPYSMDSLSVIGWPLHSSFAGYYNKQPPRINQIDADQIFTVCALWMAKLKAKSIALGGNPNPFAFSAQDFYLVLRNALMVVFDNQYFTQFLGNNEYASNSNAFLGFFVMGHNAGNDIFGQLNVPVILAENLGALKAKNVKKEGGKNPKTYLPMVGRYYRDTLPQINIVDENGITLGPLFAPQVTPVIDPIDCTTSGVFVNVQGDWYQTVLDDWNGEVNKLKQYSVAVQQIASDWGPKGLLGALSTRLVDKMATENVEVGPRIPARLAQSLDFVENKPYDVVVENGIRRVVKKRVAKKEGTKNVEALPDASILSLTTTTIISKFPITQEASELFDLIILPVDRVDATNDVLLKSMIQVMGRESYSYEKQEGAKNQVAGTGAGEWSRLNMYANEFITGLAREETTKFQQIFKKLITDGNAGMLAGLLGGIAKGIFPGMDGVIDTISSMVPI